MKICQWTSCWMNWKEKRNVDVKCSNCHLSVVLGSRDRVGCFYRVFGWSKFGSIFGNLNVFEVNISNFDVPVSKQPKITIFYPNLVTNILYLHLFQFHHNRSGAKAHNFASMSTVLAIQIYSVQLRRIPPILPFSCRKDKTLNYRKTFNTIFMFTGDDKTLRTARK
jgi:hypothetical protein